MDDFKVTEKQLVTSEAEPGTWGQAIREMIDLGVHKKVWDGLKPSQVRDFGYGAGIMALARATDCPEYD